ncbi:hypothetical protein [Croceicoccus hydrothermalis]|uniref:hypothetical protein n=1 Tax=Croceicoccus hydrothermalis TaxID=2867964 RepID=UPI001EFB6223|nr:hypothetical protein [Croceicoccus hydrothermalis]
MKAAFKDAMRVQLDRILTDQIGNGDDPADDARANRVFAEFYDIRARRGIDADFTPDHFDDLLARGWSADDASCVAMLCHQRRGKTEVTKRQLDDYASSFKITPTGSNLEKLQRLIYEARAAACLEAARQLPDSGFDFRDWIDEALRDDAPLAYENDIEPETSGPDEQQAFNEADDTEPTTTAHEPVAASECAADGGEKPQTGQFEGPTPQEATVAAETNAPYRNSETKTADTKLLKEAAEDCIAAASYEDGWSPDTIKQVRTAIAMFDFASGNNVEIENITQESVVKFKALCRTLPNRWGRTTAEREQGFPASLARAKEMPASEVGISQKTMNKHLTWIAKVIEFGASAEGGGHRTAEALDFKSARATLTKNGGRKAKRKRDLRANWTPQEVRHILSAPVWSGSAGLDDRLNAGDEIFHDAWYYLPIMLPLYGGRSSELAGLRLADVHEDDPIPYMQIDYSEDRDLKNVQSIRKLPIHPELIRLGFIDYVQAMRGLGHTYLFPEMKAPKARSFADTFRKSIFEKLRAWAFPEGTEWRHRNRGAWIDKNVHSYRGMCTTILKGKVADSVRCDIFGHEGQTETERTYDEEAELGDKLIALEHLSFLTEHIEPTKLRLRPPDRQRHGAR